jgi:hypothetical protein
MGEVIQLHKHRESKELTEYKSMLLQMDKLELMEEMVRFQEWRAREGRLTMEMMQRGIPLFQALENAAETIELRTLTRSYRRHLEFELAAKTDPQA